MVGTQSEVGVNVGTLISHPSTSSKEVGVLSRNLFENDFLFRGVREGKGFSEETEGRPISNLRTRTEGVLEVADQGRRENPESVRDGREGV